MTLPVTRITHPEDPLLDALCDRFSELAPSLEAEDAWPAHQLEECGRHGVFEWFVERDLGGQGWSEADLVRGYLRLSAACLTTTFVITQRTGACRRIALAENDWARRECLPSLINGQQFATVGVSHLTTSRRHLDRPVLRAELHSDQVILNGFSPWVTGAEYAEWIVVGAVLEDGQQVLVAVPRGLAGVRVEPALKLTGLSASCTGPVTFERAAIPRQWLLDGPSENVMRTGRAAQSGGLQTSTLAVGLADSAIGFVEQESRLRSDLSRAAVAMRQQWQTLCEDLLAAADGRSGCSNEQLRARANSLVMRATQAALAAAKGAGYVVGHPAGRWCREALFFLVWSCPQPVVQVGLCELAGIHG